MAIEQKTIAREVTYRGIGLHTGNEVEVTFKPAPLDHGIVFKRLDLEGCPEVPALIENVTDCLRGTSIGIGNVKIHTVEHILCACAGLGIRNLLIELSASEPPAGDGSSKPFVELMLEAGIVCQGGKIEPFKPSETVEIIEKDRSLVVIPADELRISFTIDYDNTVIGTQYAEYRITEEVFKKEIMAARTYGFYNEVEMLKAQGLALGGTVENAIVVGENEIIGNTLRWKDEFVRHKILDILGDLFLLGRPILAHVIAVKSGHSLNVEMTRRLKALYDREQTKKRWDVMEIMKTLPHRYPFLLVDRILEIEEGVRALGVKNVTINEHFFQGHYPSRAVMPGVLIVEALSQVAGVLMLSKTRDKKGLLPFFAGIDNFRFRKTIEPGDTVHLETWVTRLRGTFGKVKAEARVEGKVVAEGELMFSLIPEAGEKK